MRVLIAIWLIALPILSILRLPAWASDGAIWSAAAQVAPVSRRTWANVGRWDRVLLDMERRPLRQPFSRKARP